MSEDLTPRQFAALVKIGDFGTVSQNRLGRAVAMDPATSQGVTQRLMAKGLIGREPDLEDRRRALLSLTEKGEALVEKLVLTGVKISARTLEPLTAEERRTFLTILKKLT